MSRRRGRGQSDFQTWQAVVSAHSLPARTGPAGAQQFAQAKTVQHAPRGSPPLRALSTPNGAIELRGGMGIRLMHTKHPNSLARAGQCKSSQGATGWR